VFLSRTLYMSPLDDSIPVVVTVYAPVEREHDWSCRYTIDWPDAPRQFFGYGVDSVQAFMLAMGMIGAELYTSEAHKNGQLRWFEPGDGYGFPVSFRLRDLLVGFDAENEGL
jgi:hypothetical protein